MQRRFGPEFNLGGLAGLPFTGKTGFGAFAAHVPKDGHIFIVYAPHVGISRDGAIGYYPSTGTVLLKRVARRGHLLVMRAQFGNERP